MKHVRNILAAVLIILVVWGMYCWFQDEGVFDGMCPAVIPDGAKESGAMPHDVPDTLGTMTVEDALDAMSRLELPQWTRTDTTEIVDHMGYMVNYNMTLLIPNWVAYRLSEFEVNGHASRSSKFRPDPDISCRQACDSDYRNSGWDRGHMAPAADMKWSTQAMYESFYLTNVCPQNGNLNRGDWKELEDKVRDLALRYHDVYVVCGPVVKTGEFGRIGDNGVTVPDAFFKALMVQTGKAEYSAIGFIMYNKAGNRPLPDYACTVDSVEVFTGLDLFHNMPDVIEQRMESSVDFAVWGL